jgi:hypothetical protein
MMDLLNPRPNGIGSAKGGATHRETVIDACDARIFLGLPMLGCSRIQCSDGVASIRCPVDEWRATNAIRLTSLQSPADPRSREAPAHGKPNAKQRECTRLVNELRDDTRSKAECSPRIASEFTTFKRCGCVRARSTALPSAHFIAQA